MSIITVGYAVFCLFVWHERKCWENSVATNNLCSRWPCMSGDVAIIGQTYVLRIAMIKKKPELYSVCRTGKMMATKQICGARSMLGMHDIYMHVYHMHTCADAGSIRP
ncbi:unnamed protein product [Cuscuta europaea]|uniref:Uncharacterized protein n=1 Tax=Cuscuta europaea TaxID=41803 RepID=A0A9P0YJL2_CUSEU|nr:unnamed protein product [Cuscuta europaea]